MRRAGRGHALARGGPGDAGPYGAAPSPDADVTYQPDVVIVAGGGSAVRSVSDDALTWRIDPGADARQGWSPAGSCS
ncbi:hypothetical protein BJF78_15230 [Pseudonocardia sp. CNS-139]|nr:hypothetical protein BJF78_15230 [Pseudonocardia sp. CNS-139]